MINHLLSLALHNFFTLASFLPFNICPGPLLSTIGFLCHPVESSTVLGILFTDLIPC